MSLVVWMPLNGDVNNQGVGKLNYISGTPVYANDGKLGKCLDLSVNPTLSFSCDELNGLDGSNITIAFWVNVLTGDTSLGDWRRILFLGDANASGTSGSGFRFEACFNSNLRACSTHNNTTNNIWAASHTIIPNDMKNQWHHVCVTMDGSSIKSYRDGVLIAESTSGKGTGHFNGIIQFGHGGAIRGKLNDFRIYDRALSLQEIKILSQCLLLHYPMTGGGRGCANLVSDSYINTTSSSYGFGVRKFQITEGKTYTVSARGCISDAAVSSGTHLAVYFYKSDWSYCPAILQISSTTPETKFATFTATQTSTMTISSYSFKSQGTAGDPVTAIWYKVEEANKPTPWIPHTSDTAYTTMGYNTNTEYDTSGYLHNGTINGSVSYSSDTPRYSVSTHFTASGSQHIVIPSMTLDMKNITFAAWGKFDTTSNWMRIFDFGEKASGGGYGIIISNGASGSGGRGLTLVIVGSGGTSLLNQVVYTITTGVWFHVAVTILDSSVKVYVNGNLEKTYTVTALNTATPLNLNYIGKSNWSSDPYLEGNVSDFRLYATALSAEDIQKLYNTSASLANNGTLMAYEFTEV